MEFKVLAFLLLVSVSASSSFSVGSVVNPNGDGTIKLDYGPEIAAAINNIIAGLTDPLVLFKVDPANPEPIKVDLGELTESSSIPLEGTLEISSLSITGLPQLTVDRSSAVLNGVLNPLPFDVAVSDPKLLVEADYSINALISKIIPIRGSGLLTVTIDEFAFGLNGNITGLISKLILRDFDFDLKVGDFKLHFEGLQGDPGLSDVLSQIITQVISTQFLDPIKDKSSQLHTSIVTLVKDLFTSLGLTLSALLDLLKPKPTPTTADSLSVW